MVGTFGKQNTSNCEPGTKRCLCLHMCVGRCMHIVIYASTRSLLCSEKSADHRLTSCETENDVMFVFCCQRVPCAHEQLLCAGAAGGTHLRLRLAVHRLRRRRM